MRYDSLEDFVEVQYFLVGCMRVSTRLYQNQIEQEFVRDKNCLDDWKLRIRELKSVDSAVAHYLAKSDSIPTRGEWDLKRHIYLNQQRLKSIRAQLELIDAIVRNGADDSIAAISDAIDDTAAEVRILGTMLAIWQDRLCRDLKRDLPIKDAAEARRRIQQRYFEHVVDADQLHQLSQDSLDQPLFDCENLVRESLACTVQMKSRGHTVLVDSKTVGAISDWMRRYPPLSLCMNLRALSLGIFIAAAQQKRIMNPKRLDTWRMLFEQAELAVKGGWLTGDLADHIVSSIEQRRIFIDTLTPTDQPGRYHECALAIQSEFAAVVVA